MAASSFYELPRLLILMGTAFLVSLETDLTNAASTVTKDYCEGETFRGRCSYDEVISIDSATYGRMQLDRCVQVNMGYVGCQANVLDIADEKCSGRRSCDVTVPDPEFERRRPCLELKSYLLVSYHCAKVLIPDSNDCRVARSLSSSSSSSRHPPSQPSSGQLASIVAAETGCGSPDRPWIVEVPYGQQINLTLVDFTTTRRQGSPSPTDGTGIGTGAGAGAGAGGRVAAAAAAAGCVRYARVVERSADGKREESVDVCGRQGRERRVYSSRGHVVRVIMDVTQAENPNYFLIGYQALGCPDPVLPEDQYFIRADDGDLVIGCRHSPDRWRLTCRHDNQWQGEVTVNCTSGNVLSSEVIDSPEKEKSPNAVLVAVLCIMLILLVLLTALIAVLLYKRRRRLSRPPFSEERHQTTVKETKPDSESVTYTADEPDDDTDDVTKSRKNQRYGRHVTRHSSDQNSRRHHGHHHRHHVYDSPIVTKNEDRGERGSEYEKVETCQTIGHFSSHIWNTPLPKVPGQS